MTLLITERDIRVLMERSDSMDRAMDLMERVFVAQARSDVAMQQRVHLDHPPGTAGERSGRALRVLPCLAPTLGAAAARVYSMNKEDDPRRPAPSELLLVYDYETMQLEALVEDYSLHVLRTAAPSGVATRHLARGGWSRVGVIGTGRQARGQLAAVASVVRISGVRVFGRDPGRLRAFCDDLTAMLGVAVEPCRDPVGVVAGADVVITATNTAAPVLLGEWLEPGTHVNSIAPGELDDAVVRRSRIFCSATDELLHGRPHWPPFPGLAERGEIAEHDLPELAKVVDGQVEGRRGPEDITVFVSTGLAAWDVAVGVWALEEAERSGVGTRLWDAGAGRSVPGFVTPRPSGSATGVQPCV